MVPLIKVTLLLVTAAAASMILSVDRSKTRTVAEEAQPVIVEWKKDLESSQINYTRGFNRLSKVEISKLGNNLSGESDKSDGSIEVSVDQLERGPYSLRGTIYHELGHSVFNLRHGSCKMMRSIAYTESEYRDHWSELVAEYLAACKEKEFEARY